MATLIISEKNKAAQAIAEALGPVKQIKVDKGLQIYHVPSRDLYVLPLRGHIQQHDTIAEYDKWNDKDPREMITNKDSIVKKPQSYARPFISALKQYAKLCDLCIIGTDSDIEGCTIGLCDAYPFVRSANPRIQLQHLWLNDLQKQSVQAAFSHLMPPKWSLAFSGEARSLIDAIIGFSATREVSMTLRPVLQKIGAKFTSIGRVQSCLLYLLYQREELIRNFVPTPFWTISATIIVNGTELIAQHMKNNFNDKAVAESIHQRIKNAKEANIQDVQRNLKKILPPTPLNTSDALQLLTQKLGITAESALKLMEELYLNKILSYPRTESDVYPNGYDHMPILQAFLTHSQYGKYTRGRFQQNKVIPRQGKIDAGDHTPISPLQSLELNSPQFENDLQRKVYDLISRHYLALFGDPAEEADTKVLLSIDNEPFTAQISVLTNAGFYEIAPFLAKQYSQPIDFSQSKILPVKNIVCEEKKTQPPPRYTDTTILKLMEQKNLGTKSTRPNIIQILIDRQYVERRARAFYVKELGFLLIDNLKVIWLPFLEPTFTAHVEAELEFIQKGQKKMEQVVELLRQEFLVLFDKFRQQKATFLTKMQTLESVGNVSRGKNNQIIDSKNKAITTAFCPKCKKNHMELVISKNDKRFLVCQDKECKTFLSLPQKGFPKLLKTHCSLCGFDVVAISTKLPNGKKSEYYLCPFCWTEGFKNSAGGGFCSKCPNFTIDNKKCIGKDKVLQKSVKKHLKEEAKKANI